MRVSDVTARLMSAAVRVYVAVQLIEPGASYWRAPSPGARSVRLPLLLNRLLLATIRWLSWASGSGLPVASCAVPCTCNVFVPVCTAAVANTLATVWLSVAVAAPLVNNSTVSPGSRSGVKLSQHTPPGWLTSNNPVLAAVPLAVPITTPLRSRRALTASPGETTDEKKSRCGNTKMLWPGAVSALAGVATTAGATPARLATNAAATRHLKNLFIVTRPSLRQGTHIGKTRPRSPWVARRAHCDYLIRGS